MTPIPPRVIRSGIYQGTAEYKGRARSTIHRERDER